MKPRQKKAQVTIFIILGVVILLAVGLFFLFKGKVEQTKIETGVLTAKEVPQEINPVKLYIDSYIQDQTKQALKIALAHGGYIDYKILKANKFSPTDGNSLELIPDSNDKIPYWHYMISRNTCGSDCAFSSEMPPLCKQGRTCITNGRNSVEEQIEKYISQQIKNLDLKSLETGDIAKITPQSEPKVKATIRNEDVVIYVQYPLLVKTANTNTEHKIEQFQIITETSLTELYEAAKKIAEYESSNCFIGKYVSQVHMPAYYWSGKDFPQKDLPPTSELTIGNFNNKIFIVDEVKKRVKEEISKAVSDIGIEDTANVRYPEIDCKDDKNKLACGLHYQRIFQPFDRAYDIEARMSYNSAFNDIYFDINPKSGSVLMPKNFASPIPLISGITQTKIYEYSYDYSFPVLVELRKKKLAGDDVMRFAVESNIRGNRCYSKPIPIVQAISLSDDLSCDSAFQDKTLQITVLNEITKKPVEGAEVSYYSGYGICPAVITDSDGKAEIKYPDSDDTVFIISKEKYIEKNFRTDAQLQQQASLITGFATIETETEKTTQEITPIINKSINEIEFRLLPIDLISGSDTQAEIQTLRENNYEFSSEDYSIVLTLTRYGDDYTEQSTTSLFLDKGKSLIDTLDIAPGKYNISAQIILNKNIILPEEKNRLCIDKQTQEIAGGVVGGVGGGAAAGAALGGTVGSVVPVVGTFVVGAIGGYVGGKIGSAIGGLINECEKKPINPDCTYPGSSMEDFQKGNCYKSGYKCDGSCEVDQDISTPEINLGNSFPLGGVIANDIIITADNLNKEKIIFYLIKENIPTRVHHLQEINKYENVSLEHPDAVQLKFG